MRCTQCASFNPIFHRFCCQCGCQLAVVDPIGNRTAGIRSERRVVTVLFSDLAGYTSISEKLDPEEIKDLMSRIFGDIAEIATSYEGFIDKFIGDAAMILFGVPISHEDDPVRAVRTALEIHQRVEALGRRMASHIRVPLRMHSGINTGLIVIDEIPWNGGEVSFTGDTINMAARLENMAQPGEILVGSDTYDRSKWFFEFQSRPSTPIKGKADCTTVYKLLAVKKAPDPLRPVATTSRRLFGRESDFKDLRRLFEQSIQNGDSARVNIVGDAGIGKSRLVDEFKASIDPIRIRWMEGRAYAYARQRPYTVFIDLMSRLIDCGDGHQPEQIRQQLLCLLKGGGRLTDQCASDTVCHLMSLLTGTGSGSVLDGHLPESRKARLFDAALELMNAVFRQTPAVLCLDDLHWADPSSVELLAYLFANAASPILFLSITRPTATDATDPFGHVLGAADLTLVLNELSKKEINDMIGSLLDSEAVPPELNRLIGEQAGGNPFYIEQVLSTLIECKALVLVDGGWQLSGSIGHLHIPATLYGIISGRLDRLNAEMKQILKEAAVIGRIFSYRVLHRISALKHHLQSNLESLVQRNLIAAPSDTADGEYRFKQALTQEVIYQGMLRKERKDIHEHIGRMLEKSFKEGGTQIDDILAYHFTKGHSIHKAIHYLVRSGEKSLKHYCLEEAHRYFSKAYDLLSSPNRQAPDMRDLTRIRIDLINKWAFVYYYRGHYRELLKLLEHHRHLVEQAADPMLAGMFHAWLGCTFWHREQFGPALDHLKTALTTAERCGDAVLTGYVCAQLSWVETEMGCFDKAIALGRRARDICRSSGLDPHVYVNSMAAMGYGYWHQGRRLQTRAIGQTLLDFGERHSESRSKTMGFCCLGWSHLIDGDLAAAAECFQKAVSASKDPWYGLFPKLALSYGLILNGRGEEALGLIDEILRFNQQRGAEFAGTPAAFFKGLTDISRGRLPIGMAAMQSCLAQWHRSGARLRYTSCGLVLAIAYVRLAQSGFAAHLWTCLRHPVFFIKTMRSAEQKASDCFQKVIAEARESDAGHVLGMAYFHWGMHLISKKDFKKGKQCLKEAVGAFKRCQADIYLQEAIDALESV